MRRINITRLSLSSWGILILSSFLLTLTPFVTPLFSCIDAFVFVGLIAYSLIYSKFYVHTYYLYYIILFFYLKSVIYYFNLYEENFSLGYLQFASNENIIKSVNITSSIIIVILLFLIFGHRLFKYDIKFFPKNCVHITKQLINVSFYYTLFYQIIRRYFNYDYAGYNNINIAGYGPIFINMEMFNVVCLLYLIYAFTISKGNIYGIKTKFYVALAIYCLSETIAGWKAAATTMILFSIIAFIRENKDKNISLVKIAVSSLIFFLLYSAGDFFRQINRFDVSLVDIFNLISIDSQFVTQKFLHIFYRMLGIETLLPIVNDLNAALDSSINYSQITEYYTYTVQGTDSASFTSNSPGFISENIMYFKNYYWIVSIALTITYFLLTRLMQTENLFVFLITLRTHMLILSWLVAGNGWQVFVRVPFLLFYAMVFYYFSSVSVVVLNKETRREMNDRDAVLLGLREG